MQTPPPPARLFESERAPFPRFFLWFSLLLTAAGVLADPRLLARLFSSHPVFSDDIVHAVQTLRFLLLAAGLLGGAAGLLLHRCRLPWYRALNNGLMNTLLFLCTLAVAVVIAEVVLRSMDPWGVSQFREARRYFSRAVVRSGEADLGYMHKPLFEGRLVGAPVKINSQSLRDREFRYEKPASVFRILCLGDSVTFGWGVPGEDTFAKRLETLLNRDEALERFQVINAGVGGYNTRQEAAFYTAETRKYGSDLVLLFYTINDAAQALTPLKTTPVDTANRLGNLGRVLGEIFKRVFATLYGFTRYMALPKADYLADYRPGSDGNWVRSTESIQAIRSLARENGSEFAVFMVPTMQDLLGDYPFAPIHERMAAFCGREGIPLFDLLPDFQGRQNLEVRISIFDGHPNRFAHDLIARAVETRLAGADMIPVPRKTELFQPDSPVRRP